MGHRFYMKSAFTASIPDRMVDACLSRVEQDPGDGESSFSFWAWGRAIARVDEDATAFARRDAAFWVSAETMWDDPETDEAHIGWARSAMAAVTPFALTGRYVNDVAGRRRAVDLRGRKVRASGRAEA
jgi:hypothetical protein